MRTGATCGHSDTLGHILHPDVRKDAKQNGPEEDGEGRNGYGQEEQQQQAVGHDFAAPVADEVLLSTLVHETELCHLALDPAIVCGRKDEGNERNAPGKEDQYAEDGDVEERQQRGYPVSGQPGQFSGERHGGGIALGCRWHQPVLQTGMDEERGVAISGQVEKGA